MIRWLGFAAAIILPFWNIPLIVKIQRRKSSRDISMAWALGVFVCLLFMFPSGIRSPDPIFRVFTVINLTLFSLVVFHVVRYR